MARSNFKDSGLISDGEGDFRASLSSITGFSRGYARHLDGHFAVPRKHQVVGKRIAPRVVLERVKDIHSYTVVRVLSPFEFYVQHELDTRENSVEQLYKEMQDHYDALDNLAVEFTIEVTNHLCYAYQDKDMKWYRVRVHDFELDDKGTCVRAFVHYCDSIKTGNVLCASLRQLLPEFLAWETPIYKCYLYDLLPMDGSYCWCPEAVMFFKDLVANKSLKGVVMKFTQMRPNVDIHEYTVTCGMVLFDKAEDALESINWILVKYGYARAIGFLASSPLVLYVSGEIPRFLSSEAGQETLQPLSSVYSVPIEDIRDITKRAMAFFDGGSPEKFTSSGKCLKSAPGYNLPTFMRDRLAWIRMSYLKGPDKIFVHMQNKVQELANMEIELGLSAKEFSPPELVPGTAVSCEIRDFGESDNDPVWRRAIIYEVAEDRQWLKVILVDYGNILKVHFDCIGQLPKRFREIPSFVHRLHLESVYPIMSTSAVVLTYWTNPVCQAFTKYIMSYETDVPIYYVHFPNRTRILDFVEVEQGLIFDTVDKQWIPEPLTENSEFEVLNSMSKDPLLASHFKSLPVDIFYEQFLNENDEVWKFSSLTKVFVDMEYGALICDKEDNDQIHMNIVNGFCTK